MNKYVIKGTAKKIYTVRQVNDFNDFAEVKFKVHGTAYSIGYVFADEPVTAVKKFKSMESVEFNEK